MKLATVLRQRTPLRSLAILLALSSGPVACARSCGAAEGEKTYETLDGKVKVSLVRKVAWTEGKIPGPQTSFVLRDFACRLEVDETRARRGNCSFRVDDARRRIDDVRRAAASDAGDAR